MEQASVNTQSEVESLAGQLFDQYADARINGVKPIEDIRYRAIAAAAFVAEERGTGRWAEVLDAAMAERHAATNLKIRYEPRARNKLFIAAVYYTGLIVSETRSPEDDLRALLK